MYICKCYANIAYLEPTTSELVMDQNRAVTCILVCCPYDCAMLWMMYTHTPVADRTQRVYVHAMYIQSLEYMTHKPAYRCVIWCVFRIQPHRCDIILCLCVLVVWELVSVCVLRCSSSRSQSPPQYKIIWSNSVLRLRSTFCSSESVG